MSRCQNLKSEFNDQPWAGKVNDGGFIYTAGSVGRGEGSKAARGGANPPSTAGDNGLRSYAGMTYSGLKSMIYAQDHTRRPSPKAAIHYIKNHYTLEENPGQGQRGLYYYYQTFAKAMALLGSPTIMDNTGKEHNWRDDLVAALAKRQDANGSWVNRDDRFMEGDPNIVTSYAAKRRVGSNASTISRILHFAMHNDQSSQWGSGTADGALASKASGAVAWKSSWLATSRITPFS